MVRQEIKSYDEAVEYLLNIPRFTSKNSMEDTKAFLRRLGNPDEGMKIIHVAGTNGKGSVCAYLRYMLEEAGYAVCSFTSPHLVDMRERFLIRGEMVSKEKFLEAFQQVYEAISWDVNRLGSENQSVIMSQTKAENQGGDGLSEVGLMSEVFYHPTFFEYLFFMAMLLFREAKPDFCILETGLGGRLDATNSVAKKELAVITRISLDHMEYLGDTTVKIAGEKAGIIAQGTPVVYLDDERDVSAVFDEKAKKVGAKACPVSKADYALLKFQNKSIDFSLRTRYYKDISVTVHTAALYQMENAALAVRALEELDQGRTITVEHILNGLAKSFWPGRMEELLQDVFVDGAHNEDGVRAFLESVAADNWQGERILLFSAVKDKQFEKMLGEIIESRLFGKIFLVSIKSNRATKAELLEETVRILLEKEYSRNEYSKKEYSDKECSEKKYLEKEYQKKKEKPEHGVYGDVREAMKDLLAKKQEWQRIYIAGSLYLVGEVKANLGVLKDD